MKRRDFITATGSIAGLAGYASTWAVAAGKAKNESVTAITGAGRSVELSGLEIGQLATALRGPLLLRSSKEYETVRRVWNGAIDKRPALIARCVGTADVIACVRFAKEHGLLIAVRGGGHSISGKSTCDQGFMIDLSLMRHVSVDPLARTAVVAGGALLGDLDRESQAFGLATTAGTVSHTGVGGLTLGGGLGRLVRKFGMAIDNVISAQIITADGRLLRASAKDNSDLFWGIRGGGGNFGVVTSFEFQLHQFGPDYHRGELVYSLSDAPKVLRVLEQEYGAVDDDCSLTPVFISAPDNNRMLILGGSNLKSLKATHALMAPFKATAKPLRERFETLSYVAVQSNSDELDSPGQLNYMKAGMVTRFDSSVSGALIAACESATLPVLQTIAVPQIGGAMSRIKSSATAFPYRDAQYMALVTCRWPNSSLEAAATDWARNSWKLIEPSTRGVYSNMLSVDDTRRRVLESFGTNYERMVQVKTKYDPTNLFRLNANVEPRETKLPY